MTPNLTATLADFVAGLEYENLPAEVVQQAKRVLMDALGCALAAHKEDKRKADIVRQFVHQFGAAPQATVIGGGKSHAAIAALANGMLINAADNDDTHKRALLHVGSVVVPPSLATSESRGGAGRDLIVALVAGFEVAARVGMAVMPSHYRFWHSTGTNGTFGAAASAARGFGLSAEKACTALGLAGTQAAGLNTFFESGDDTKSLHPGKAGMNGVLAAMLAELGATSPEDILGHAKGYLAAYSLEPRPQALTAGLGEQWEIVSNGFKFYPSILASHSPIGASLAIAARDRPAVDRIRSVAVNTYATVKSHFSSKDVRTSMAARLSVPYCVAAALADGKITQAQFAPARFNDPVVRGLLEKVEVVVDPELSPLYPEKFPARVAVTMNDGKVYEETVLYPKGDPANPLSPEELTAKFRDNLKGVLSDGQTAQLIALIDDLENITVAELADCLGAHAVQAASGHVRQ
jgi:2-methylcitrate dehydratase PrpD